MDQPLQTPEDAVTTRLPFEIGSVRTARLMVSDGLAAHGATPRVIEDVNLVVGELVANGICHGRPTHDHELEVSWWIAADLLGFSVRDGGGADHLSARMPHPDSDGGRGLAMVENLAQWWAYDTRHGTRVTAEVRIG